MNTNRQPSPVIAVFQRAWRALVFRYAGKTVFTYETGRSRKFYDVIGRFYDWLYAEAIYDYEHAAEYMISRYIQPHDFVLDVGCGTGLLSLLSAAEADLVVGLDTSIGMIRRALKKSAGFPNIHYVVGDCRRLPLQQPFDNIITSFMMVILNRQDQINTMVGFKSLLREGGEVVFLTARESAASQWLSRDDWQQISAEAGFDILDIEDILDGYRIVRLGLPVPVDQCQPTDAMAVSSLSG